MANTPLDLIEVLLDASSMSEGEFIAEHPHPVLVPERVRSGLLARLREGSGSGTLKLGGRQPGESAAIASGQLLVLRKTTGQGRLDRFEAGSDKGTWIILGRQADADVMINDFSVSQRQAGIRRSGSAFQVQDLGSTNGTSLNGKRLEPNQPGPLKSGDQLDLGRVEVTFLVGRDLYRLLAPTVADIGQSMGRAMGGPWGPEDSTE